MLTLATGLGLKAALERVATVRCDIRWPNDIMIRGKKCSGILVEMSTGRCGIDYVIVGVGVNLNHRSFPPELDGIATSLRMETGRDWTKEDILGPLLEAVEDRYRQHQAQGPLPVLDAFRQASSYVSGRRVIVEVRAEDPSANLRGVTAGLDRKGRLLLRGDDGSVAPVVAGSVRPDPGTM